MDRDGCPDRDGDGTSDLLDGWTSSNPNFVLDGNNPRSTDYNDVEFSPDGLEVATSSGDGYIRIWNTTTGQNTRSVIAVSNGGAGKLSWSDDGRFIGVTSQAADEVDIYYASNLTSLHGAISSDVGGSDFTYDIDLSPDGSKAAIAIGRSGNSGTNGVVRVIDVINGTVMQNLNPEEKTVSIRLISRQVDLTSRLEQLVITMLWTLQAGRQREAKAHLLAQSTQSLGRQAENTLRFAKVTYRTKEVLDCVFSKPMFGAIRGRNPLQPHAIHPIFHRTVTRLSLV